MLTLRDDAKLRPDGLLLEKADGEWSSWQRQLVKFINAWRLHATARENENPSLSSGRGKFLRLSFVTQHGTIQSLLCLHPTMKNLYGQIKPGVHVFGLTSF